MAMERSYLHLCHLTMKKRRLEVPAPRSVTMKKEHSGICLVDPSSMWKVVVMSPLACRSVSS